MKRSSGAGGPLVGLRVVEIGGIGPVPFAAMLLSDLGAEVVRIDRPSASAPADTSHDLLLRGRRSAVIDLQRPEGVDAVLQMIDHADALIEGFRPGVMERLGLGPEICLGRNPRLIYGRMTGWGQDGPWAQMAGHDINYTGVAGALHPLGRRGEAPSVPVNILGDFAGGSLYLVMGILAALWEGHRSGRGQVVDAAIVDGAASLTTMLHGLLAGGSWLDERGVNLLDTGRPFYDVYETSDGGWMAVGPLESRFFREFTRLLDLPDDLPSRFDPEGWPLLRSRIAKIFLSRSRNDWEAVFVGTDACVAPVLGLKEAPEHPHLVARGTFIDIDRVVQPAPAPRFERTPGAVQGPPAQQGEHTRTVLEQWGVSGVESLLAAGVAVQREGQS